CPVELTGRYSVIPSTNPSTIACHHASTSPSSRANIASARTSCHRAASSPGLQHPVPRAHALGRLADVEPEVARRFLDQVGLGICRAVHPLEPPPEDVDLARAGHVELEAVLLHPDRAAGYPGLPRRPCRRSSRACHPRR